jgi:predicted small metal-binding protein
VAKILKCSDVNPGCSFEVRGDSEAEVMNKNTEHARIAHKMRVIPDALLSKTRSAIHDEGEARGQFAGTQTEDHDQVKAEVRCT